MENLKNQTPQQQKKEEKNQKQKNQAIIIIGVAVVILIVLVLIFTIKKDKDETVPTSHPIETTGRTTSGGSKTTQELTKEEEKLIMDKKKTKKDLNAITGTANGEEVMKAVETTETGDQEGDKKTELDAGDDTGGDEVITGTDSGDMNETKTGEDDIMSGEGGVLE